MCSTPLIKLPKLSAETGCTIAVKAEHQNPGGSVKDRAALYLIREAEKKGTHWGNVLISESNFFAQIFQPLFGDKNNGC